jgi:hypothetical protein
MLFSVQIFLVSVSVKICFLQIFLSSCDIIADTENLSSKMRDFKYFAANAGVQAKTTLIII